MATKTTESTAPAVNVPETESSYSGAEFAAAANKLFGVSPDIVTAAFAVNNMKCATLSEAIKIVKAFASKEVSR